MSNCNISLVSVDKLFDQHLDRLEVEGFGFALLQAVLEVGNSLSYTMG